MARLSWKITVFLSVRTNPFNPEASPIVKAA